MKEFIVITGLLVISLASLSCSYPENQQNGITNVYDNYIPSIQGGFISQLLKNILGFIQGILIELEQISQENFMKRFTGNWASTNDNISGANKFDDELDRSQKMTQSPKISGSMTTTYLSDADDTNESQYSDEKSPVEPQIKNEINKDNIDMAGKSDFSSANYNFNEPKQIKYELNRSQKMTQSPKISRSMTTTNLSDADEINESQYSDEESPVEPQIKNEINKDNVDMAGKSDFPSTNYNLNEPKQIKYELNRSQKMTQSPKISGSMTTTNLSDADETNSNEESPVEPQIKKIKNEVNGNVDMMEKFVPAKPRNMPDITIGGQNSPLASKGEILNMERVKSIGKNTGFEKNVGNSNVQTNKDTIDNQINVNCETKSFEYGGKTYVDSEYEIEYGGSKKIKTAISGLQLTGLKTARKLSEKESAWVKEKLKSCYDESEEFYDTSEEYEEE